MPEYQLQIKQVVDYPRCRIYREFIHKLINDRSIRINGGSGLFHFTVLCSYANFRTSYRRIDGISYTVSPGEWVCTVKELSCWFRTRFHRQALSMLDTLQKQHLISYTLLGRGNVVKYKILHWARHNSALEYNAPCQKDTGFFFLPVSVALELVSSARCSEMDIVLDLWVSAVYNDTQVQGSEVGPVSELAAKIQQLHIFFSLLIPDMSHEERQLLDEALVRTYNTKGITHDNASLEDPAKPGQYREMPVLGDLYEILKTSKETMRMAHILNRLVNGSASTFNKQTNVRLDNKYTVLDISSLTGDLLTVGMFVALDFVWDRAKADRTEEKAIFIDECWQLLSGAGAAGVRLAGDFLLEIAKTIRGYGGASIFASQDLADFFDLDGGRFGKGIINNSKTKIILNLEDDEAQRVQEALHLSDAETMEITHFERGHGLISTNNNNIMVEFKASPLEKDLITTDRRELREIVERKRREQSTSAEQQI